MFHSSFLFFFWGGAMVVVVTLPYRQIKMQESAPQPL